MSFLPLTPGGQTPPRVMTIAGSDSGGGAGIQADMRTFALLGVHACVAVTAVTVQNSMGVKGFHEIPLDVIAGQIEAVASDIGIQAAKTGMLASSAIIGTIADTWRSQGLAGTVPLVVDPVCASMHGDPLLHPSALDSLRNELFPLATLVTPNLDEVRLIVDIDVVDDATQRDAARALHALGPQWALVKGGHLRSSPESPDLLVRRHRLLRVRRDPNRHRRRPRRGRYPGRRNGQCAGARLHRARRGRVREDVGDRMSACRLPVGPRPRPGVAALPAEQGAVVNLDDIAGIAHEPDGKPKGAVVLTHGAGGSREAPLLKKICDEWAARGWLAVRYNLPYRRRRPKGPPSGSAAADQAGVVEAVELVATMVKGPVIAGGHSYGGRMTSMAVADGTARVGALTLFSYPLHPPGKPERARTEHLPRIEAPTVFTHGTSDPFGSIDELRAAAALIPAATEVVEITGARHDLGSKTLDVPRLAVDAALRLLP